MKPPEGAEQATAQVPESGSGVRLDRFLAELTGTPRNQVRRWILEGRVKVGGQAVHRPARSLETGEQLVWQPPPALNEDPRVQPEDGPLEVLWEDPHLVVLDKPAGLVVHPGAGNTSGTLAHRLLARYPEMAGVGGPGRPGIVHRLDQGTSGVIVVARSPEAYRGLTEAFAQRRVKKIYLAVVYGNPRQRRGSIEAPIGRHPSRRKEMALRASGRPALTRYRSVAAGEGLALLEVDLGTGRTHQIRVHLKSLGHPLVGDPTYGENRWKSQPRPRQRRLKEFGRPALHAFKLELTHPLTGEALAATAPVPKDLLDLWQGATGRPWPLS